MMTILWIVTRGLLHWQADPEIKFQFSFNRVPTRVSRETGTIKTEN